MIKRISIKQLGCPQMVKRTIRLLIESKHAPLATKVRSYRGADVNSDHFLIIADLKQKLPQIKKYIQNQRKIYNIRALKSETIQQKFIADMALGLEEVMKGKSVEEEWANIRRVIEHASEKLLRQQRKSSNKE